MINLRQNKGFALTFSLLFLFLIISFIVVYMISVSNGYISATRTANTIKAYYAAEAGLADAYERIVQSPQNTTPPSTTVNYIPANNTDTGVYSVGSGTPGSYSVSITANYIPRINYTITSTGTYNNVSKTLQLKIIGQIISSYAYWSQTEINPLYGQLWWVGEPNLQYYTYGPVQTNGSLNIWGNPVFYGPVTEATPSPTYMDSSSIPDEIWLGGLANNAPVVNLPPQGILNAVSEVASSGGLVLTGPSTIIFNPTTTTTSNQPCTATISTLNGTAETVPVGTITVTGNVVVNGTVTTAYNNSNICPPSNGSIYVQSSVVNGVNQQDGNVTVQGTVNGQLTVAADQNIYLAGSISYNDQPVRPGISPGGDPNSTDLLGLVANQNITVIQASAPTLLEVEAVMVALQGSFQVDQWWVYRGNASTAVMDQFGSLINYVCGVTGEMDWSGNLDGGWNQLQSYDTRLNPTQNSGKQAIAPPGFPPYVNNQGLGVYAKTNIQETF